MRSRDSYFRNTCCTIGGSHTRLVSDVTGRGRPGPVVRNETSVCDSPGLNLDVRRLRWEDSRLRSVPFNEGRVSPESE